jgi:hypothetical protein
MTDAKRPQIEAELASEIVAAIIFDLGDRRGLRQEWDEIDNDVRAEIVQEWERIVREKLTGD